MYRILFPVDLGCELTGEIENKKIDPPRNVGCAEIRIYKFGIAVIDFIIDIPELPDNLYKLKLANRMTIGTYRKYLEDYIFKIIQPYKLDTFSQCHKAELLYPVRITAEKIKILKNGAEIPLENVDILRLSLAQWWNLVSYDVFLNKELDFAQELTNKINPTFNFIHIISDYILLFKEEKDFIKDKLSIINSLCRLMRENPYNSSPEFIEFYNKCSQGLELETLKDSVFTQIESISDAYARLSEKISGLFFLFFELGFFIWLFWGIIDTILLWQIGHR